MGHQLYIDIQGNNPTILILTTDGANNGGTPGGPTWSANRNLGLRDAIGLLSGPAIGSWNSYYTIINSHNLTTEKYIAGSNSVTIYHINSPNPTGCDSSPLAQLQNNSISYLITSDGNNYTSWNDFVQTLAGIVNYEKGSTTPWVSTLDNRTSSYGCITPEQDHIEHIYTGRAVNDILSLPSPPAINIAFWKGYNCMPFTNVTLNGPNAIYKLGAIGKSCSVLKALSDQDECMDVLTDFALRACYATLPSGGSFVDTTCHTN